MKMEVTRSQISDFFADKRIAIAGVSRNEKKFGNQIFKELTSKNYEVIPINPNTQSIDGVKCYNNINDLPSDINSLLIATSKNQTDDILESAIKKGIPNIWVQQSCESKNTLKIAEKHGKSIIYNKCLYMFTEPVGGIHKFHRTLVKIFGNYPK